MTTSPRRRFDVVERLLAFRHALRGLWDFVRDEPNAKIHVAAVVVVVAAGFFFRLTGIEWSLAILATAAVVVTEVLNTAIERLADRVTREHDELIRQTKDLASAAVLLSSIGSFAVGIVIFGPKIIAMTTG